MGYFRFLCCTACVMGFPAAATAASILGLDGYRVVVLSVRLNGFPAAGMPEEGIILREQGGYLFVKRTDLALLRLRLPPRSSLEKDGSGYVALDTIPALSYRVVPETQVLEITAAPEAFEATRQMEATRSLNRQLTSTGAFLNYNLDAEWIGRLRMGGQIETGVFGEWGILTSTFTRSGLSNAGLQRLQTSLVHDFPSRRESFRLGDSVATPGVWGIATNFAGVHWGTDFSTQPDFVTFPVPVLRGDATSPSTADMYVNGTLRQSAQVPAGPFELVNPPLISGPGQITLIVRDALGREVVTTQSYFATPLLLAPGVSDYSVDSGWVRRSLGGLGNGYATLFGAATYRRGLTDRFTVEARAEIAGAQRTMGVSATFRPVGGVVITNGIAASEGGGPAGMLGLTSVEWQTRKFAVGVQGQRATEGFRQLGFGNEIVPTRRRSSAFASFSPFTGDHLTASFLQQDGSAAISTISATDSINLGSRTLLSSSFSRILSGRPASSLLIALDYQIDDRTLLSPSVTEGSGRQEEQVRLQRNLPLGTGMGYEVAAGNDRQEAELDLRNRYGTYEVDAGHGEGSGAFRAGVQGAVALLGGKLIETRSIDDGFAVVKVGHFKGVHVLADNQPVAVTDGNGEAVVPRLLSFQPNRISIDANDLPMDAAVGEVELIVRPGRRRGVRVAFPVSDARGILVFLSDEKGAAVPSGAVARLKGAEENFPVAMEGAVYVTGIAGGPARLEVRWAAGRCVALFRIEKEKLAAGAEIHAVCARDH